MECSVCVEVKKKMILCNECSNMACLQCYKSYFLTILGSKCMSCGNNFSPVYLKKCFDKKDYNELIEYKKTIYENMEKHYLVLNQKVIEDKITDEYLKKIYRISKERNQLKHAKDKQHLYKVIDELYDIFTTKCQHKNIISSNIIPCRNCRGILVDYICTLCGYKVCKKCLSEIIDDDHICNKEEINNIDEIKKISKPCPKCFISIEKIEGCDQMWCIKCHTAFSWNSGKIDKGKGIHNPHYYDWLTTDTVKILETKLKVAIDLPNRDIFIDFLGQILTIKDKYLPETDQITVNERPRILYITNKITEEKYKTLLVKNYKKHEYKIEMKGILEWYIDKGVELLQSYETNKSLLGDIIDLKIHVNSKLMDLQKNYGYKHKLGFQKFLT